jgi:hypothetical protein
MRKSLEKELIAKQIPTHTGWRKFNFLSHR